MENVTLIVAFTAGILSFFSPCVFPLIPAYVSHLTGSAVQHNKVQVGKGVLLLRSTWFVIGFSVVFVLMGASASFIGQWVAGYRDLVEKLSGLFIIIFGLQMARVLNFRFLMFEKSWDGTKIKQKGGLSSFLLGLAFGTGWTPCVGLALSSILLLAGSSETLFTGMSMLSVYSLGMGIPFLVISLLITYSLSIVKNINRWLPTLSLVNGWIMVGMGLLLFTGQLQKLSAWLTQFTY
ncbi:cytochrome c biogenesis protein CcdA [Paenibacillus chondroitinus]|uniref:Cytochrome c biogenesis protein CcdA n=1 Tax=Paenibacillus chondroitinus TaxID=59842 RepID=A0ABU6DKZ4_9BACL|nr:MULTISPECIES: cytochrome c biogenesis protein CcdA [Paenibacillus]MCY9657165.1 cytochrome c biogenesis protein CcdA [Paenibacillus anseongense]MEB4798448.1 cytochrome c biogenesis protein CcdA [Paenibacillus chondroitinus]